MSDENAEKKLTDELSRVVLDVDDDKLSKLAEILARRIKADSPDSKYRIVVTGPAGSGKSTIAPLIAKALSIPCFDLDEYIEGGFTHDQAEYGTRLLAAWNKLWDRLPSKTGWVVEHVEACNPLMLEMFKPQWALILKPDVEHLKTVAEVRDYISKEPNSVRKRRAMDTAIRSTKAFDKADGVVAITGKGWELKRLINGS